jgi:hypothetical protein
VPWFDYGEDCYLDEEDICSCFCKGNGHGLTNATSTSRHQSGLALEGEELLYGRHVSGVLLKGRCSEQCWGCNWASSVT